MSTDDQSSSQLVISDLSVSFGGAVNAVRGASISIARGQIAALVGESGSGKSATAMSVLGLLPDSASVTGSITFEGTELLALPEDGLRAIRGMEVGTVFQEPMTALNPALRIGTQIASAIRGGAQGRVGLRARTTELLDMVHVRDPELKLRQFPHELSGGQRQRVMIAMAIANRPRFLIADEPTTALDVTVQAEILDLIRELRDDLGMGVLLITHDLGVVANIADVVNVMNAGQIVESNTVAAIFNEPQADYTKALLSNSTMGVIRAAVPTSRDSGPLDVTPAVEPDHPLLEFQGLSVKYPGMKSYEAPIVKGIDIEIRPHETLAIVGESGSGKSTLGRALTGLLTSEFSTAYARGVPLGSPKGVKGALTASYVFQDNASALNPRQSIGESILAPRYFAGADKGDLTRSAASELLEQVGLDPNSVDVYPHQLSGGQRQRVGIARAIARRPELMVADEPTSALDVSVQKRILMLLAELQSNMGFSCVFITHDLHLVRSFADRVVVLQAGRIQEVGNVSDVLSRPTSDYTKKLLASTLEAEVVHRS